MKIAVLASMNREIAFGWLSGETVQRLSGLCSVRTGVFGPHEITAGVTGMGKVNAAAACAVVIDRFSPDLLISTGCAGSLTATAGAGDIIIGLDCLQHDYDLSALGYERGAVDKTGLSVFASSPLFLSAAGEVSGSARRIHYARILTGDRVISDIFEKERLRSEFGGAAVDMESAALAQVCHITRTPFGIVRSVSDDAGEEVATQIEASLDAGAAGCADVMEAIFGLLGGD